MSYHNLRDKSGRFARRTATIAPKRERKSKTKKSILNFFLLDDTGSMNSKVPATIEGFNQVLRDGIKASKENGVISIDVLAKFGEPNYFVVQDKVKELTAETYNPQRGSTALWKAVVDSINQINASNYKTDKVILTIFTDGDNNDAHQFKSMAKNMVKIHQDKGWVINFIGAGSAEHIQHTSAKIGIFASNTVSYSNNSAGTRSVMAKMSNARTAYTAAVADSLDSNIGFFSND